MNIDNTTLIGLAGFVLAYVASRVVRERALKRLTTEEKARLLDAFSGYRTYFMSAAVALPLLYFVILKSSPANQSLVTLIFVLLFGLLLVLMTWLSYRKLAQLNLPTEYIRSFLISSGVQYLGIAFLFAPMIIRSISY